ncbi:MAG: helix-turn-helix transcriptional regulator [Bacteroidales bacterium]
MIDNKRLNTFLEERKISTKELADKLGITHSAVSLIRSGKNQMRAKTLTKLLDFFPDLCPKWLMTGIGTPTCTVNTQVVNVPDLLKDNENKMLKELLASKEMIIELLLKMNQQSNNLKHD